MTFKNITRTLLFTSVLSLAACKSAEVKPEAPVPAPVPITKMESFQVIGIKTRTSNSEEAKGNGKISKLWGQFFSKKTLAKIPKKLDGDIIAIYYDYESDSSGPYSLLVGAKVAPGTKAPRGMETLQVPAQEYRQFVSAKGEMPGVVIDAWKQVWTTDMKRKYSYDLEVYGEKARDPKSAQVDLYISL